MPSTNMILFAYAQALRLSAMGDRDDLAMASFWSSVEVPQVIDAYLSQSDEEWANIDTNVHDAVLELMATHNTALNSQMVHRIAVYYMEHWTGITRTFIIRALLTSDMMNQSATTSLLEIVKLISKNIAQEHQARAFQDFMNILIYSYRPRQLESIKQILKDEKDRLQKEGPMISYVRNLSYKSDPDLAQMYLSLLPS